LLVAEIRCKGTKSIKNEELKIKNYFWCCPDRAPLSLCGEKRGCSKQRKFKKKIHSI